MTEPIKVTGLKEFNKGIKKLDKDLPKGVRVAFNGVADIFVAAVRPKIPRRTGRAAASLKAQSTQTLARVSAGGPKAPWYPWLDFGGRVGRKKSVVRQFYREGRYIYPTLSEQRDKITTAMQTALVGLARDSGVEVE